MSGLRAVGVPRFQEGACSVPLLARDGGHRGWTLVDEVDLPIVLPWTWRLGHKGYAHRSTRAGGKKKLFQLHREILRAPAGAEVDHINGDKLDNRRSNLRLADRRTNTQNIQGGWGASGLRNVRRRPNGKWEVIVKVDGRTHYGGRFSDPVEASLVAEEMRCRLMPGYVPGRSGLRAVGGSSPRFQKGTGIGLVGVPGHQATADCPKPVYLVHASRHGRTIAPREFTDPLAARLWAIGLTEAGWIIRRETREAS